ncbi:SDR family NAD(P)-dependent oxidoreductase [Schumannella luteola]
MALPYTDSTVLITGASSGLGAEFARQLAARGADLVLVARRLDRLESLAADLRSGGRTVEVVAADLAAPGAARALGAELESRGIRVDGLINNAGFATRNRFEDEHPERIHEEVALNVAALVDLTAEFYPQLQAAEHGILVNVASTAAYQPVPWMAVYGATKSFVLSFTEALWFENKLTRLRVLALSPGATRTEFFDVAGEEARVGAFQSAEEVVSLALRTLDGSNPPPSIVSGARNRATVVTSKLLSRRALVNVTGSLTSRR